MTLANCRVYWFFFLATYPFSAPCAVLEIGRADKSISMVTNFEGDWASSAHNPMQLCCWKMSSMASLSSQTLMWVANGRLNHGLVRTLSIPKRSQQSLIGTQDRVDFIHAFTTRNDSEHGKHQLIGRSIIELLLGDENLLVDRSEQLFFLNHCTQCTQRYMSHADCFFLVASLFTS